MTTNPADLVQVRAYCAQQTGQTLVALGIAGDDLHAASGGYHIGGNAVPAGDYSRAESSRDRSITTTDASAFDLGGNFTRFRQVTLGIVAACKREDIRARDIREVIYTPDGVNILRWDRLGYRTGGDSSHLSHTHVSFFRDSAGRRHLDDNFLGLLRELFEGTGDTVDAATELALKMAFAAPYDGRTGINGQSWMAKAIETPLREIKATVAELKTALATSAVREQAAMAAIDALSKAIATGGGDVDVAAIKAEILDVERRTLERLAAAKHAEADALDAS